MILARFFSFALSDKEQIDHKTSIKHNTNGSFLSFLWLACSQLEHIYIIQAICTRENPSLSLLCEQHTAAVSSRFINIYIQYSSSDPFPRWWRKAPFRRSDFFLHFFCLSISSLSSFFLFDVLDSSLWCRSASNELNKRVRARAPFNYPCFWGFLTVLIALALSDSLCLFANDSFSRLLLLLLLSLYWVFFFFAWFVFEENRDVSVCIEPSTNCHHYRGRLLTDN